MGKENKKEWGGKRERAGRPSLFKEKKKNITLTLTESTISKLTHRAEELHISRSDYINMLFHSDKPVSN